MTFDIVNAQIKKVPFFRFLDFTVTEFDDGHVLASLSFADRLMGNPILEHYHGGMIASFMEAVAAISTNPDINPQSPKPINLTVDYLRPAIKGPLFARATVARKGKRMASVRTVSWQDEEARPVAEGMYHFLMV